MLTFKYVSGKLQLVEFSGNATTVKLREVWLNLTNHTTAIVDSLPCVMCPSSSGIVVLFEVIQLVETGAVFYRPVLCDDLISVDATALEEFITKTT